MEYNYSDIDLARYFSGQATPEERITIEEWSKASAENKELFDSARFVWERSKNAVSENYNTESALSTVHNKLNFNSSENEKRKGKNIFLFAGIAAAAAVLIAVLFISWPEKKSAISEIAYVEISSGNEIKYLKLADSSEVWLNKNSKLSYPAEFKGGNFKLKLEGEAYFEVAHNPQRVFSIETNTSTVKVLGTAFNIKARDDNDNILSVTEGKVLYSKNSSSVEKVVEKGKEARINKNEESIVLADLKDNNFLSWKTRVLKFRETPFDEVVKELSEYYNVHFEIKDSSLSGLPISTTVVNEPVEEVIKLLQMSSDEIEISKSTEGYQVNRKK
jgi:ferric-dicitrate binding protein FerR (iron transport regulator)